MPRKPKRRCVHIQPTPWRNSSDAPERSHRRQNVAEVSFRATYARSQNTSTAQDCRPDHAHRQSVCQGRGQRTLDNSDACTMYMQTRGRRAGFAQQSGGTVAEQCPCRPQAQAHARPTAEKDSRSPSRRSPEASPPDLQTTKSAENGSVLFFAAQQAVSSTSAPQSSGLSVAVRTVMSGITGWGHSQSQGTSDIR